MNILVKIISIGMVTAFLSAVIKKYHPEYAVALITIASIIIFYILIDSFSIIFSNISDMMNESGIKTAYIETILKIVGIAYLSEYCAAVLYDANETAIAKKVELAGKIVIFIITIPVIQSLMQLILSIL